MSRCIGEAWRKRQEAYKASWDRSIRTYTAGPLSVMFILVIHQMALAISKTHLKLCLADAIHNFKWVKIIPIWQNGGKQISNLVD